MCAKKSKQEEFDIDHLGYTFTCKKREMIDRENNLPKDIKFKDKIDFLQYKCSILKEEITKWKDICLHLESIISEQDDDIVEL
jgi:hypothetical protein